MTAASGRHLVLVGAGHAHLEVLRRFGRRPVRDLRLTLVTRSARVAYSGMIPGVIAGRHALGDAQIDVAALARRAGADLCLDAANGLDLARRHLLCAAGPPLSYDLLSLDPGGAPDDAAVPGAAAHAIPVKPLDDLVGALAALRARLAARGGGHVAVVGAGAGGIEILLALEHRLRADLPRAQITLTLVCGGDDILPGHPAAFRERVRAILAARGIGLAVGARAVAVEPEHLHLAGRPALAADAVVWATGAAAPPWLRETGLPLDADGFVRVDASLRVAGCRNIFAAGDAASFDPRPLPKSGVYAVRQGPVLARNLARCLTDRALRPFRPQGEALTILATGDGGALATRNGLVVEGAWVRWWKDRIDRRFVARYRDRTA
ncbi:FAD-dependent oxidoreductase [Methylobacterium oryzisoli]|uniref:FAD-dependent oxidoreductase n=1 Tax=Methylobacterium oryzisoli TaxID=3385502 RepID=UPI0038927000